MNKNKNLTRFAELYEAEKAKPTPAQAFIKKCADLCCISEMAVRMWIAGDKKPNALCRRVLADHFGVDPDTLFETSEETAARLLP